MEVNKISQESFEKAMKVLFPKTEEKSEEIVKAEKEAQDKVIEKAAIEKELQDTLKKAEDLKNKLAGTAVEEKKKEEVATPAVESELVKGLEAKVLAFTDVIGKTIEEKDELKKALDEVLKTQKELVSFNEDLVARIAKISKQPLDRKSVSIGAAAVERFEKGEKTELEKGFRTLNLNDKNDRAQLSDIAFGAAVKDGKIVDREFEKAVKSIELKALGDDQAEISKMARRFKEEHKIVVVKN